MKCHYAGWTDTGKVRAVNQDAYYIDPQGRFFIVADGMGGHAGGQEASQIAAQTIQTYLETHWQSTSASPELLNNAFLAANDAIVQDQQAHRERADMGTTAVAIVFRDADEPWCGNIGDSRLYRMRDRVLEQISHDQTWVAQAVANKLLTPEDARIHPWRHILSQCLGRTDSIDIEIIPVDVQPGDYLLLCSDGLSEELTDQQIEKSLKSLKDCETTAKELVGSALAEGGRDNITVVVVAMESEDQKA
ncbi:MAG: PP2C family serine/threonine-protein phosphatase [Microcoleaceae cyanobacterium]